MTEHSGRWLVPNGIRGVEGLHCSRVGGRPRGRIRDDAVPFVPNRRLGPRARRRRHDVHQAPAYGHPAARPGGACPHVAWPRRGPRSPFKPTTIAAKMTSGHTACHRLVQPARPVCVGEVKRRQRTELCWHTAAKEREAFCDRVRTGGASEVHAQDAQRKQCNCCHDLENGGPDQVLVEAQVPAKEQGRCLGLITSGPGTKVRSEGQERPPGDGMSVASGTCGTPAPLKHTTLEHIHEFCERADSSHSFGERESWLCGREPVQCVQCE